MTIIPCFLLYVHSYFSSHLNEKQSLYARITYMDQFQQIEKEKFYLHNILLDYFRIVTNRFDEEELVIHLSYNDIAYHPTSIDGRISSIENGNFSVATLKPTTNVVQCIHGTLRSYRHGFYVIRTEKFMALIGSRRMPSILAEIEDLRVYSDPIEIPAELLRNIGLASSWQTHHGDYMGLVYEISPFPYKRLNKQETGGIFLFRNLLHFDSRLRCFMSHFGGKKKKSIRKKQTSKVSYKINSLLIFLQHDHIRESTKRMIIITTI